MTFRQRLDEIAKQWDVIRRREAELEAERMAALTALPSRFGFEDMTGFIAGLRAAAGKVAGPSRGASTPGAEGPRGLARVQAAQTASPAPAPLGTSLEDAANFGLMPDAALLQAGAGLGPESRAKLVEALAFAQRVLHTSRVPAAVWRACRQFEKDASARLRLQA